MRFIGGRIHLSKYPELAQDIESIVLTLDSKGK